MMILFQDKIIYMPGLPPYSRQYNLEDYARECGPVRWEKQHIRSSDGTRLAIAIGRINKPVTDEIKTTSTPSERKEVVVLYFQG